MTNRTITMADIQSLNPCYDPTKYAHNNWSGTLLDVLNADQVPYGDRIWLVTKFLGDKTNRLFSVWCAREALKLVGNPDPRSIEACNVAERYANGLATNEELSAARDAAAAAWAATRAAASDAARDAAWAAAWDAVGDAARVAQIEKLKQMIGEA